MLGECCAVCPRLWDSGDFVKKNIYISFIVNNKMRCKLLFNFVLIILFSATVSASLNVTLSDQGTGVRTISENTLLSSGDLRIEIWDALSGGSIVHNETFTGAISSGSWNVILGANDSNKMALEFGKAYYKDYFIEGESANFTLGNGSVVGRQLFYSPLGDIAEADIDSGTNLTLGQKITFAFGEVIDNIVDGWVRITGNLNVTGTIKADKLRDRANIIPNTLYEDNGFDLISLRPHPKVVNPVLDKDDVTDVIAGFVADPSLFYESGTWYMFFEVQTTPNSQIGYATSPDGLTWTYGAVVLSDDSIAYSYPQVFKYNGTYYMIPSTSNSVVRIYTATSFPTTWTLSETITVDGGNDPSMFQWGGKWWLLACNSGTDNGYAYYSTIGPTGGTWTAHDNNPIISADNAKCRGAGRPIVKDDYIIYFYQKGDVDYGEKVRAFKITDLTSSTFTETELTTSPVLEPSSLEQWRSTGMHTVDIWPLENDLGCLAVVDGHIFSGSSVWSIGIYECGTSGFSDDIPQEFGADKDVIEYFDSADNEYKLDLSTNGVNVDMSISTDGDANTLFIDGTNGKVGIGVNTPTAKFNIEATNVNGFDLQTSSTLTVPSITNYGIVNALTVNSAVNDEYNFIAAINTMDIDETGGVVGDVIGFANYIKINSVATATNYSDVFGIKTYLSRVGTNAAQTLTNYYGFDSMSLATVGSSGAFDGTNWYHFYAEDFAAFGGTVANTYGLYVEEQTYGTNNYGIVLNGANCMHLRGTAGPKLCAGSGTPESAVIAPIGSMYMRSDGGAGTSMYVKESGTGNTGWVGK